MSKRIKGLIEKELGGKLSGIEALAVINPRGIDGNKNNAMRRKFRESGMKMTVVKNTLARRAGQDKAVAGYEQLLDGPSALVYTELKDGQAVAGASTIARQLLDLKKADDTLELRGFFFDGDLYAGEAGVETVSKLPTREEAIGLVLAAAMSPARKLAGIFKGAGNIAGLIKAIETKREAEGGDASAEPAAEAA